SAGPLQVPADGSNAATSKVQSLGISGIGGVLDLTNNDFILDYTGTTPVTTIRRWLLTGISSGTGIISSLANSTMRLGYADNATFGALNFGGLQVDSTSILIEYTVAGDTNLDGHVDVSDLGALATNYGLAANWTGGDFTYDGVVDVADLGVLASNYQTTGGAAQAMASAGSAGSADSVPEPALTGVLAIAALCATTRRHRK
ncbi:MAG TPA: hypothetical protein VLI90_20025, partial [Tepidisphaeraceae bacterium]|nr:hypothetical protein [Tepidisphaeraceae bacterium]